MCGLRFQENYALNYVCAAPAALAFERILECEIYRDFIFLAPTLDLGCGDGLFAKLLFVDPIDVGIDPDPLEIQAAKRTNAYKELIGCFGDHIPKENDSYNTVFSNSVLEHIEDLDPVLQEVHRILKPSGVFFLTVPTDRFDRFAIVSRILSGLGLEEISQTYGRFYNKFWKHHHCYTPDDWAERLTRVGFSVVTQREYATKAICTLHDVLTLVAFPAFLSKKILRRWIVFTSTRRIYAPLIDSIGHWTREVLEKSCKTEETGGLIFFALRKI